MNDIMFFLMLFFLIASLVINPNVIRVQNPRSESGDTYSKQTVNITLTKDLQLYIDKRPVSVGMLDSLLQNYPRGNNNELSAVLYVDRSVDVQHLVDIMDACNRNQVKMVLATDKEQ
ncbi:biopolymer transport protein ExbD [Anseongella ginsenosidimutans]|uniref:Biopolymer transport protein ExbD n=2 Tax=Anseongella ginsenosidimutans TaxID=496056 RepID=A0A4R3KNB6_9SPHI|nr:biopolymer transport protein ExbD [Anseongella ginsenosidimutans]